METLYLRGSDYASPAALHAALKRLLDLPDYYGMNADALYDCLSERAQPVNLWIADPGEGETADALKKIVRVVAGLGGEVKEL